MEVAPSKVDVQFAFGKRGTLIRLYLGFLEVIPVNKLFPYNG